MAKPLAGKKGGRGRASPQNQPQIGVGAVTHRGSPGAGSRSGRGGSAREPSSPAAGGRGSRAVCGRTACTWGGCGGGTPGEPPPSMGCAPGPQPIWEALRAGPLLESTGGVPDALLLLPTPVIRGGARGGGVIAAPSRSLPALSPATQCPPLSPPLPEADPTVPPGKSAGCPVGKAEQRGWKKGKRKTLRWHVPQPATTDAAPVVPGHPVYRAALGLGTGIGATKDVQRSGLRQAPSPAQGHLPGHKVPLARSPATTSRPGQGQRGEVKPWGQVGPCDPKAVCAPWWQQDERVLHTGAAASPLGSPKSPGEQQAPLAGEARSLEPQPKEMGQERARCN